MQRRSVLYIANFLLPVLFFLCLDFASLLMSDTGGEKIGFKITVLLAVTVMQLILNDILPSSSDKIPLIGTAFVFHHSGAGNTLICFPPLSGLLYGDFWSYAAQPLGDHFGDTSH